MKIHGMLPDQAGFDCMETLCNRLVAPVRDPQTQAILHFDTAAGNLMQVVFTPRDTTCQTCNFVWKKVKLGVQTNG